MTDFVDPHAIRAEIKHQQGKFERLRAENEKLRAALQQIATGDGFYGRQAWEYKKIARAALAKATEPLPPDESRDPSPTQIRDAARLVEEWE